MPVVLALNVMDALRAGGGAVDTAGLAQALGIPVMPVSAAPGAVQSCGRTRARVLADEARRAGLPPGFAATQWLDSAHGDHAPEAARQAVTRRERETGRTRGEALPTARFAQVDRLTRFFTLPQTLPGHRRSARIDRVLTGRYTAYPAMAALLGGKMPHVMTSIPGGNMWVPTESKLDDLLAMATEVRDWVNDTVHADTELLAKL